MSNIPKECRPENAAFFEKADRALRSLFERAKVANELHFAFALFPEFRGLQDPGWNTAFEAERVIHQYLGLLEKMSKSDPMAVRVQLSLYLHVAEGSAFYEVPKKLMLTIEGKGNNSFPFANLVREHSATGARIAPNANAVMRDLIGHATTLGLNELADSFRDAFDADIRNGYAHADYIISNDAFRLPRKNGGFGREIPWDDFTVQIERGINFYELIRDIRAEYVQSYDPPKVIRGQLADEPEVDWVIYRDPYESRFGFTSKPLAEVLAELEGKRNNKHPVVDSE